MERRLRQPPEGRAVSCPFSLPQIGNTVPLFLRESVWLPSERRLAGGQQVQGQVGRESSEGRRATGATRSWFGSRQRAAEGWAPCSGDDPGVHRSAALRRGSRCSRELLPSPGGQDASTLRDVRGSRVSGHYCCALGSFPWLAGLEA